MNAGQDFTSGAEKVYTYPSASTPTSAPTSFGTSAGGSGGGTGAGNGYPLCEGLPPANYCDGTGDCVNQPTWCSCSDAAALCAANGYPMVTKAAKQAKMAAAKKTGLVAKAAPTHLLSSPGKKMKPCATGWRDRTRTQAAPHDRGVHCCAWRDPNCGAGPCFFTLGGTARPHQKASESIALWACAHLGPHTDCHGDCTRARQVPSWAPTASALPTRQRCLKLRCSRRKRSTK
jgi:hypothetical protein